MNFLRLESRLREEPIAIASGEARISVSYSSMLLPDGDLQDSVAVEVTPDGGERLRLNDIEVSVVDQLRHGADFEDIWDFILAATAKKLNAEFV